MKIKDTLKHKIMCLIAKIFGNRVIGIDYAAGSDKTVRTECYKLGGKMYVTSIKVIK